MDPENEVISSEELGYYEHSEYPCWSYQPNLPVWRWELDAFLVAPMERWGKRTKTKYEHCKTVIQLLWPELEDNGKSWNPWLERCIRAFTNQEYAVHRGQTTIRTIVLTGCAGAGKTFAAGLYTVVWWLADPSNSIAYFCSTSKPMIRRRIWPIIQKFARGGVINRKTKQWAPFGANMVDSTTTLQFQKGDDKYSISALAVAQGETTKAVARLSGQHAERILLVIDEGQATPEAIYATIPNLRKACQDLTIIVIENPCGKLTGSGRASEPKGGWQTVGIETKEWQTKGVPEWQLEPGIAIRFDGADSPNVLAGKDKWPFIYTCSDWQSAQDTERMNTLAYWVQDRGMHPPDGACKTVFSHQLVERCDGYGSFTFFQIKKVLAALDPAFGGDACVLRFAELGDLEDGRQAIQLGDIVEIQVNPDSQMDLEKQIAISVMDHCRKRGVRPEDFGTDTTGIGRGVAYALSEEWSPLIRRVEFGGMASEMPASADDPRPSKEVYDRRVTELWWSVREFLVSGQIKGFDKKTVTEFCTREYNHDRKYKLETKEDMKLKLGYSPDRADACSVLVEVARQQGFELVGMIRRRQDTAEKEAVRDLTPKLASNTDELYEETDDFDASDLFLDDFTA